MRGSEIAVTFNMRMAGLREGRGTEGFHHRRAIDRRRPRWRGSMGRRCSYRARMKPVAVPPRGANPECNLFNGASLPASPFRTDEWLVVRRGDE